MTRATKIPSKVCGSDLNIVIGRDLYLVVRVHPEKRTCWLEIRTIHEENEMRWDVWLQRGWSLRNIESI